MTVVRIPVGGGTPEGTNSAYLVDERVLVDPGPPTEAAWSDLQNGLEIELETLADIEYVVCTHWHADHVGLAPRLAQAADATVAMGKRDAPLLAAYAAEREARLDRDAAAMVAWGVPEDVVTAVVESDRSSPLPHAMPVESLVDGQTVAGLEVLETPGHTAGHVSLATDEALVLGDAVLPTYTPNVGGSDTRTRDMDPLGTYLETLDRLLAREGVESGAVTLRPGHGETVDPERIETIRDHHDERTQRVVTALEKRTKATPWDLARDLFGELEGIHAKFGAGEVAAHLERLQRDGVVVCEEGGRYALTKE
ncbi:MBL fold metallo-hydrolase [Natronosalvus halobius]|uniref:MBL fold metallo-hydrolase n=1 Tax=Natronosalvus halobius TaxID=2953746 RepID=UPI00209D4FEF|nr:MBL fold metallo-hydrolase [Natronosalvus halobius]USZ72937.1 MBL fold metallo-hydrolase [Natronosalvus halobius]